MTPMAITQTTPARPAGTRGGNLVLASAAGNQTGDAVAWNGGKVLYIVEGTFDGASVTLHYTPPGGPEVEFHPDTTSQTAALRWEISAAAGDYRQEIAGGTSPVLDSFFVPLG